MLSLFMPQRHREGTVTQLQSFLSLALEEGESSTSCPDRFTPGNGPQCLLHRWWGGLSGRSAGFGEQKNI